MDTTLLEHSRNSGVRIRRTLARRTLRQLPVYRLGVVLTTFFTIPSALPAQSSAKPSQDVCLRAQPAPTCRALWLTNFGIYVNAKPKSSASTSLRGTIDWGFMVNVDSHVAVGTSWFLNVDEDDFTTGPSLRLRFWFDGNQSLELGVGTPVTTNEDQRTGSVYGLIKYNPIHSFGLALRPESVKRQRFSPRRTINTTRMYVGAEFSSGAGIALSVIGAVALGILVIGIANSDFFQS